MAADVLKPPPPAPIVDLDVEPDPDLMQYIALSGAAAKGKKAATKARRAIAKRKKSK